MQISNYNGPKVLETILFKKHQTKQEFKERFFKFNLNDKTFSYKLRKEESSKKIYYSKELKSFQETVNEKDKNKKFTYGFQLQTSKKLYILFCSTYEDYLLWIRLLKFFFYKVDLLNQFSAYSLANNYVLTTDNQVKVSGTKQVKNLQRGAEYRIKWDEDSPKQKNQSIENQPPEQISKPLFFENQPLRDENPKPDKSQSPPRFNKNVISNVRITKEIENKEKKFEERRIKLENTIRLEQMKNLNQRTVKSLHLDFEFENSESQIKKNFLKEINENNRTKIVGHEKNIVKKEQTLLSNTFYDLNKGSEDQILNFKDNINEKRIDIKKTDIQNIKEESNIKS